MSFGHSSLSDRNPRRGDGASIWILPTTDSLIHFAEATLIEAWLLDFGFGSAMKPMFLLGF
ncbi:hypothetical protein CFP56_026851 [Quercus suber]|uniref:Uncharacterized protein n=1 Tax=Quercus suber TaxID=58331 RepID=A0AAW0LYU7_QUESU